MEISGDVKVCCVVGDPVEHSLSPVMHNAAFEKLGLSFVYVPFRVERERLGDAVAGIRGLNIRGFNVTTPHKTTVMSHLDEVDPTARDIGAVNAIDHINQKFIGYNSDGVGGLRTLEENRIRLEEGKVVMLGAGGAAKALAYHIAKRCRELVILNRTPSSAHILAGKMRAKFAKKIHSHPLTRENLAGSLKDAHLLINATSTGMHPAVDQSLVDKDLLRPDLYVFDIVYNPVETRLLRDAKAVGAKTVDGVGMLVYQGAFAFEMWTGCEAPVEVMRKAVLSRLLVTNRRQERRPSSSRS